jgi:ribosomal protein L32
MLVWPEKYRNRVCPHCGSKKIRRVVMQYTSSTKEENFIKPYVGNDGTAKAEHFLCNNCKRVTYENYMIWKHDRKEMKRDAERLLKFLTGE